MKFQALLILAFVAVTSAFTALPATRMVRSRAAVRAESSNNEAMKVLPMIAALTAASPAFAAFNVLDTPAGPSSLNFLPPILVPIVGIVAPGFAMALAFIWTQMPQKEKLPWGGNPKPEFMKKWDGF